MTDETGSHPHRRRFLAALAALGGIGVGTYFGVSSCSGGGSPPAARPTPKPKPKPQPRTRPGNPFTGIGTAGRVLAVKIDNVGAAQHQQAGLNSADLVYVIQVEGGLSRYLAVFDSGGVPSRVGPVRSARQTDIPLLAPYGHVGFVYSGAITGLYKYLDKADVQNISQRTAEQLFSNGGSSPTYVDPAAILRTYPQLTQANDVGFRFGAIPGGGKATGSVSVSMPTASFTFTASANHWLVSCDGSPVTTLDAGRAYTDNVVIQHVDVGHGLFTDHNAAEPANEVFSQTTGHGTADFYRDGYVWHGQWSKPSDTSPTSYTVGGTPFQLKPGRTWIVLLGTGYVG
ncbi:MAG TPA: DUF3048 domain-containing protein [Actinospica sp.]|jgi:hypothetical protein|nr:DUF3048 domain-containing protein [Actinospica sp.]